MEKETYVFHVVGMHCKSCVLVTEEELKARPDVSDAVADLGTRTVRVTGDFDGKDAAAVASALSPAISGHGYSLSVDAPAENAAWGEFTYAVPIALVFLIGFVALQKAGLVNLISAGDVTYATAFVIGLVASVSTCMAVVGGLVLSMSATFAREGDRVRPQLMFHASRIITFFVLGGVIGAAGASVRLGPTASATLSIAIALVMLLLGLNLLDVFDWAKKLQPAMPKFIARHALGAAAHKHVLAPLVLGAATFFLPCGFTQSMQLYALTTGGFMKGGLTMLVFALGTLPVLALVSFSSLSVGKGAKQGVFFKTAGLVVIAFALLNLAGALAVIGIIPPLLNF